MIVEFTCRPGSTPCGLGDGDCNADADCQGALVCGQDNCGGSGGLWDPSDDCCTRCSGVEMVTYLHQALQPRESLHAWTGTNVKPPETSLRTNMHPGNLRDRRGLCGWWTHWIPPVLGQLCAADLVSYRAPP